MRGLEFILQGEARVKELLAEIVGLINGDVRPEIADRVIRLIEKSLPQETDEKGTEGAAKGR